MSLDFSKHSVTPNFELDLVSHLDRTRPEITEMDYRLSDDVLRIKPSADANGRVQPIALVARMTLGTYPGFILWLSLTARISFSHVRASKISITEKKYALG